MVCRRSVPAHLKFRSLTRTGIERESIESRAQLMQAEQYLLTMDLQLADLKLKLNDLMGLPLTTVPDLDPVLSESRRLARSRNPLRLQRPPIQNF